MVSVKTIGCKTDLVRNCVAESTAYLFVIILNFIFTPFYENKIERDFKIITKLFVRQIKISL